MLSKKLSHAQKSVKIFQNASSIVKKTSLLCWDRQDRTGPLYYYNYNLNQHKLFFKVKISQPQYWDILANYGIPKHNLKQADIQ